MISIVWSYIYAVFTRILKTGKFRGFAFISCPDNVSNELIKLNSIDFFNTSITVEGASSIRKGFNQGTANSENRRPQIVVNKFPENQNAYLKPNIFPGNQPNTKTVHSFRKVIIFGDSIPRGIIIHELS